MGKIVLLSVTGVFFIIVLKEQKASLSYLLSITVCGVLLYHILGYAAVLLDGLKVFREYFDSTGYYIKLILKMTGITYLCELGVAVCKDAGQGSIALHVETAGKIMVLVTGFPIILSLIEQIMSFAG